jgi:hypothetical protein
MRNSCEIRNVKVLTPLTRQRGGIQDFIELFFGEDVLLAHPLGRRTSARCIEVGAARNGCEDRFRARPFK